MKINTFDDLRTHYKQTARNRYIQYQQLHALERIYGTSLHTDDDASAPSLRAFTEEALKALAETWPGGWFTRWITVPWLRWNVVEWNDPRPEFAASRREVSPEEIQAYQDAWLELHRFCKDWCETPGNSFDVYRKESLKAMAEALAELDAEGLFGVGQDRNRITLFISMSDSKLEGLIERESAVRLNPARSGWRFTFNRLLPINCLMAAIYTLHYLRHGRIIPK